MNSGEIDRFPVGQLQDRYSLARSAVYKRMEQLGIAPDRVGQRSYITAQQLHLMDELHRFINQGGSAAEFIEARGLRQKPSSNGSGQDANGSAMTTGPGDFGGLISAIVSEVVGRLGMGAQPDPMKYFETLENAAKNGWLPSTSELAELIDLSPREIESYGDRFSEAGFIFSRSGYRKNGEIAWKVTKRLK
jgi:DNA-binding transcriptional regulator YhcF (GntR family)